MKVFFDVTRTSRQGHASGITRTAQRLGWALGRALGPDCVAVVWNERSGLRSQLGREPVRPGPDDWFLTVEPFSPEERKGFDRFLDERRCRLAAVFHDAIPLSHPEFTWPRSVARFPGYLKMLSAFDQIFAVSDASRNEISGYFEWLGRERLTPVATIRPGADFLESDRPAGAIDRSTSRSILSVGILEIRKNQSLLLEACERLWRAGLSFELTLVGRVNPHFGRPVVAEVRRLRRQGRPLVHFDRVSDQELRRQLENCRFLAFPSQAEGCGLPILEALWMGAPSLCSDLPPHEESAKGGGCILLPVNDLESWEAGLRQMLLDDAAVERLSVAARERALPTWESTAASILEVLRVG